MRILAFLITLIVAGAAHGEPVTYTLDAAHTQVGFSINRFGFTNVLGRFDGASGEIILDEANPANSSVHAIVQTEHLTLGDATRDGHVRGPLWLNTAQFPVMEFRSTSVRLTGDQQAEVSGELTLLGQTHPITLDVHLNRVGVLPSNQRPAAGFSATATLSRSVWGSTTAAALIGDDVRITIEVLGYVPAQSN